MNINLWFPTVIGAVIGSLITVFATWAISAIKESSHRRREKRDLERDWWLRFRSVVHLFELEWTPWVAEDHPHFDDAKIWHDTLFENLIELRSQIGPCSAREQIDEVSSKLSRIRQLDMQYMGQAARAYNDFVNTTNMILQNLKKLSDSGPSDL